MQYSKEKVDEVLSYQGKGRTSQEVSALTGVARTTVSRWWRNASKLDNHNEKSDPSTQVNIFEIIGRVETHDSEMIEKNVDLARSRQRLMDSNRIERKSFREHGRLVNAMEDLNKELIQALRNYKFNIETVRHHLNDNDTSPVGVIQVSDAHLNMVISDVQENQFDLNIASKRLYKHVCLSINKFKAEGVQKVVLALTGDLLKNIQHLSEISQNAMSRANATFLAVDIFSQMIVHLKQEGFDVTVASVIGNESRVMEHIHDNDFLASDNFDLMIHKMLQIIWLGKPGVDIVPMKNPFECLLNLNGSNLLLIHGHAHGRFASTSSLEKNTDGIVARYAAMGMKVDYVILGHIHCAYISDRFARSGGLPGTDEYAARKLNLFGRASQNSFIFYSDGSIDGFKHDLQSTNGWLGYNFDEMAHQLSIGNHVRPHALGGNVNLSINGSTFASYTV